MNGWQRLWILVTLLLGVYLVGVFIYKYPSTVSIEASYTKAISAIAESERTWSEFKDATPPVLIKGKLNFDDVPLEKGYDQQRQEAREKYNSKLTELSSKRWVMASEMLVFWLLASLSLYGLGWMIVWVYQGFRPKKA